MAVSADYGGCACGPTGGSGLEQLDRGEAKQAEAQAAALMGQGKTDRLPRF